MELTIDKPITMTVLLVTGDKPFFVQWIKDNIGNHKIDYVLSLTSPHGKTTNYATFNDIPDHDVPCECGDPNHWIIKYQKPMQNQFDTNEPLKACEC